MSPAVSVGGQIVAHFYDIESGAARYEKRGAGHVSGFHFPIPRDGGLLDLLQGAESGRFDVVVCESISRVARNPSVTFRVEEELREVHVKLWAVAGAASGPARGRGLIDRGNTQVRGHEPTFSQK